MPPPTRPPLGLQLARTQKAVSRAFADALEAAGGSLPTWLVLVSVVAGKPANQRELAGAVDVREATLTHHLNAMEAEGLIVRRRDAQNRRVQRVELTDAGHARFLALREAAAAFDRRLRAGISTADQSALARVLDRLRANVDGTPA
jgi:MarR family transcriptional regulator, transcriptional regulator for hemolysin